MRPKLDGTVGGMEGQGLWDRGRAYPAGGLLGSSHGASEGWGGKASRPREAGERRQAVEGGGTPAQAQPLSRPLPVTFLRPMLPSAGHVGHCPWRLPR